MADEPKKTRKRAVKKSQSAAKDSGDNGKEGKEKKGKAGIIPAPIFQAAPALSSAPKVRSEKSERVDKDSDDNENRRRRRRRGGKGRRRPDREERTESNLEVKEEGKKEVSAPSGEVLLKKRRRRRRSGGDNITAGETVEEDGVVTVVKVRESRPRPERLVRENKSFDRGRDRRFRDRDRDRDRGRERHRYSEYHENRRRGTILTDAEFLARRESVDREMLVRQQGDRTQIAILEDNILVEHYVNRSSNISYVGNVYLGKVQNVLPSMEAAFVDIGKGRNAVLYAGEVNWDAAGLADGTPRKIEHVLKTGQPVLVQVTKDPIGQKGARLTSQISLPGRYLVYVPSGEMSGISRRLPEEERNRLKNILKDFVPEEAGVIVRTASEGATQEELEHDVSRLKAQWEDIREKAENPSTSAPSLLYSEL